MAEQLTWQHWHPGLIRESCSLVQLPSHVWLSATHGLQNTRPLCPSPSPEVCPSSCPLHQWCYPAISSSDALFFCHQSFPASGTFPMSQLFTHIKWPKHWSFSFNVSPSEYLGLMSLKMDCFDLLAVQGTLRNLPQHHSLKASTLCHSAFFMVQLWTTIHDHWEDHSLDYMDFYWQSNVSAFQHCLAFLLRANVFWFHGHSHHLQWF